MEFSARAGIIGAGAPIVILLLLGSPAAGESPKRKDDYVRNIELCNGTDRASLEARINGCTALIKASQGTTAALAIAYNNRGNAFTAKADYDRAIQDFDQSIKLNPTYIKPFNNRGVAYLKKGEYELAIEAFDEAINEAIRLDPNLQAVWSGRCWTRVMLGSLQAALEDCNKALQSEPNDDAAYDSRGLIHLKMGQFGAAIDDYSSALRLDPKLAGALYGRGLARLKQGDKAGGDADISAAKTIQGNIGDDFTRYGVR